MLLASVNTIQPSKTGDRDSSRADNRNHRKESPPEFDLGARLRWLRRSQKLTLRELAERTVGDKSPSCPRSSVVWPAHRWHRYGASHMGSISPSQNSSPVGRGAGRVVRVADRRRVEYRGLHAVDEFVTPPSATRLQVILSTIEPGGGTGDQPYTHDSDEEVVLVLEGGLDLWVADEHYHLDVGDAIQYSSRLPHRNENRGCG